MERLWLTAALILASASVILSAFRAGLLSAGVVVCVLLVLEAVRVGRGFVLRTVGGGIVPVHFWQESLALLGGHPLGVGSSGFLNANAAASTGVETLDSAHNLGLQVVMVGGIPLLVPVAGIVVAVCVLSLRSWSRAARGGDVPPADLLAGALAGLAGFGVALQTHFTAPSTTVLAGLLLGVLVARTPGGGLRARLQAGGLRVPAKVIRTAILFGWAVWLVVVMSAEVPLAADIEAASQGNLAAADAAFETARAIRSWDGDLTSIAAQSFAAAADAQVSDAAPRAVDWAERSRALLPGTVATESALAVGQLSSGDAQGARQTLEALVEVAPHDVAVAVQHAVVLYLLGDSSGSAVEVRRALVLEPTEPTALRLRDILINGKRRPRSATLFPFGGYGARVASPLTRAVTRLPER